MAQWNYQRLAQLVAEQPQERFDLEFKACDALRWVAGTPKTKESVVDEISRDISSFANSAGATIIYGVLEDPSTGTARALDTNPFAPSEKQQRGLEWLDQIIRTKISPAPEVQTTSVFINDDPSQGWYYVAEVQQGVTAHQANDKLFYRRQNVTRVRMEQYEIVDVMNRAKGPVLDLDLSCMYYPPSNIRLTPFDETTPTKLLAGLDPTVKITSINHISAEYGTIDLSVLLPLHISPRHRERYACREVGVRVGEYIEEIRAIEFSSTWSAHQGRAIYPGRWTEIMQLPRFFVPPQDVVPDALYLVKAVMNGPNVYPRTKWFIFTPDSDPARGWAISPVTGNQVDNEVATRFWRSAHAGFDYLKS